MNLNCEKEIHYSMEGLYAMDTVVLLLKSYNYTCFWQGNVGELAPFVRGCSYEFRRCVPRQCKGTDTYARARRTHPLLTADAPWDSLRR